MPENEKKGITVKVDAALHAEVRQYIEAKGMTMAEFVALALDNELHSKLQPKEVKNMGNTRTIAFQVPEKMYQRIKDYLHNHHMTQKEFFLGLISAELDRERNFQSLLMTEATTKRLKLCTNICGRTGTAPASITLVRPMKNAVRSGLNAILYGQMQECTVMWRTS